MLGKLTEMPRCRSLQENMQATTKQKNVRLKCWPACRDALHDATSNLEVG